MEPDAPAPDLASVILEEIEDIAIVVVDRAGKVVRWFHGAEVLFGYFADEMIGEPLDRLFTPDDVAHGVPIHEVEVAAASGRAGDDRWEVRKDGVHIWVTGVLVALRDQHGEATSFVKIMRNRTDVRAQIEALENRIEGLVHAVEQRDRLLSTTAHELRNPLAPLANGVSLLRRGRGQHLDTTLEIFDRQLSVLRRLVDDLMDVGRLAAGKLELESRPVVLNEVLREAAEACRPLADSRGQTFQILLLPSSVTVDGDPDRLHQVFVNLIENAVKYTPEKGRISVKQTIEGGEAVVRVEDSGIGITIEALPRIFDLFTQEKPARDMAKGGLGLGLSVVRDLVALHGGTVAVRSEGRDKGAEFTVRLPRRAATGSDNRDRIRRS
jgi:PAS domain S-box-containing protein